MFAKDKWHRRDLNPAYLQDCRQLRKFTIFTIFRYSLRILQNLAKIAKKSLAQRFFGSVLRNFQILHPCVMLINS